MTDLSLHHIYSGRSTNWPAIALTLVLYWSPRRGLMLTLRSGPAPAPRSL